MIELPTDEFSPNAEGRGLIEWSKSSDAYLAFAWCRALGWKPKIGGGELLMRGVTARQAADELGVVERTVRRWISAGELPAEKQGGAFVIDLDVAREVHRRSRAGRSATASTELAELRGRYLEVTARLAQIEEELTEERRRSARLQAILDPRAVDLTTPVTGKRGE